VRETEPPQDTTHTQDSLYEEVAGAYGVALERLARAYEADPEARRDLVQDIHVAVWRSLAVFNGRCSLRTWVYRVAHNVGRSHVTRQRRTRPRVLVGLEDVEHLADARGSELLAQRRESLQRLLELIRQLKFPDRQVMLAYLEGMDAAATGEVTGLSASNVATKIHRIKRLLAHRFEEGRSDDE
jgi:RNA polymerase sigma-70 factor (ECF subfamily)